MDPNSPFAQNEFARTQNQQQRLEDGTSTSADPLTQQQKQSEPFADADLARELGELTRQANRANVTIYTIDPRGLVGMGDIDEKVDPQQWNEYVRKSQDSLRVIAEETGGIAVVNQNDFTKALKRIDAETSDYYVLGYYSKNPDAHEAPPPGGSEGGAQGRDSRGSARNTCSSRRRSRVVFDEEVAAGVGQAGADACPTRHLPGQPPPAVSSSAQRGLRHRLLAASRVRAIASSR